MPKNFGVDTFSDPVGHFESPWQPFWILQAVRRCMRRCMRLASAPFAARLVFISFSHLFSINFVQNYQLGKVFCQAQPVPSSSWNELASTTPTYTLTRKHHFIHLFTSVVHKFTAFVYNFCSYLLLKTFHPNFCSHLSDQWTKFWRIDNRLWTSKMLGE